MILFEDILTFFGLVYRNASLITLYLVVTNRNQYSRYQMNRIIILDKKRLSKRLKINMF